MGTYPPTACGLATFSASFVRHLRRSPRNPRVGVLQVTDGPLAATHPDVTALLVNGVPGGAEKAARALDGADLVVVQHEYGIYGGPCGQDVLELLAAVSAPTVVVAHTVLSQPSVRQRSVLSAVARAAGRVVTMTGVGRQRLVQRYGVDPRSVTVIPHGAVVAPRQPPPLTGQRPTLLTWGLLGPGKGIEWVIDALAELRDLRPAPRYLIAGSTHPKVLEREGEDYRDSLRRRAAARGVADLVEFDDRYLVPEELHELVGGADVVVLPYESTEQVTSGVLVDAIACGRPVVATAFPHAQELLATRAGVVVPHRDSGALAAALRRVLAEPGLAQRLAREASALAPSLSWDTVVERYLDLATELSRRRVA